MTDIVKQGIIENLRSQIETSRWGTDIIPSLSNLQHRALRKSLKVLGIKHEQFER